MLLFTSNSEQATVPTLMQGLLYFARQTRDAPTRRALPTTRDPFATRTTSLEFLVCQMEAHEVCQTLPRGTRATSLLAPGFNFTTHGHLKITIAVETLPRVIGSLQCWRNRSRKS